MNSENLHNDSNIKQGAAEIRMTEDLKFIRSVIEKTRPSFDPGSPVMIVLGLIFMIGYPTTQYLLTIPQLTDFIQPMWFILWVIGASVAMFNGFRSEIRQKQAGIIPKLAQQIGGIWYVLLLNGTVWSGMALSKLYFVELPFIWAVIFGLGLSITGILSSREWLFGGIAVLISIVAAAIVKEHALVILGITIGLGCIVPAIIAQRNYRKQERENAQR